MNPFSLGCRVTHINGVSVKIVYLDQLHWIEIAKAINGKTVKDGTHAVLKYITESSQEGKAIFPLSLSHYYETLKHSNPERRLRLAKVMRQLSGGKTVAALKHIVSHEIQVALKEFFPNQVIPQKFSYLSAGLEHAVGEELGLKLVWPKPEVVPADIKAKMESDIFAFIEDIFLSGVMRFESLEHLFTRLDTSPDDKFKQHLEEWKGIASQLSQNELERRIYSITFNDIVLPIVGELCKFNIPFEEFAQIGEQGICKLLDSMPTRRVDMHLRRQWAKNVNLTPKQSDLNDWCFVGSAVCYSDIVVTENQMNDLLSRAVNLNAKVTAELSDLMDLI